MASLLDCGSRAIMSIVWQSTLIDMSRYFLSSGQQLVDGKRLSGSASGSIRMVPPHRTQKNHWLNQRFSDKLISRKCDSRWSPYSPELNQLDFYLWGYLKDQVYAHNLQSIPDLKAEITVRIKAIPREECAKVIENFARRIQVCLQRQWAHFEHIIDL